jgi:hypothetical protein
MKRTYSVVLYASQESTCPYEMVLMLLGELSISDFMDHAELGSLAFVVPLSGGVMSFLFSHRLSLRDEVMLPTSAFWPVCGTV